MNPESPFRRKDGKVNFQKEMEDQDLLCCVCWEPLTGKIFQCLLGAHNVCESCKENIRNSGKNACPLDRTPGGFIPNPKLEKEIALLSIPCIYPDCKIKTLPWMSDEHTKECEHAPFSCPLCGSLVAAEEKSPDLGTFGMHLQNQCEFKSELLPAIASTSSFTYPIPQLNTKSYFIRVDDVHFIILRNISTIENQSPNLMHV